MKRAGVTVLVVLLLIALVGCGQRADNPACSGIDALTQQLGVAATTDDMTAELWTLSATLQRAGDQTGSNQAVALIRDLQNGDDYHVNADLAAMATTIETVCP